MSTTAATPAPPMKYTVGPLRAAGLEAKWTKSAAGAPIIAARWPAASLEHQRKTWWFVTAGMWETMKTAGILEGFTRETLLADVFSI